MARSIKPFLIMAFSLFVITSCHLFVQGSDPVTEPSAIFSECRVVRHTLGETCVPVEPKRIVALNPTFILDPLLWLGIKPVGAAADNWRGKGSLEELPLEQVEGVEIIGLTVQPSLEKILTVKPDLILGLDSDSLYYQQLSAIAPTVLLDYEKEIKSSFKKHLRSIARLAGREANAEEVLGQYQTRIETLKTQINGRLDGKETSFIYYSNGTFWAPDRNNLVLQVLNDLGMWLKPVFVEDNLNINPNFSIEAIEKYDADILFIGDEDDNPASFFLKNPLISSLEAAQKQRLYVVKGHLWRANGSSIINNILDDLSKYLLKATDNL